MLHLVQRLSWLLENWLSCDVSKLRPVLWSVKWTAGFGHCDYIVTKPMTERPINGADDGTTFQPLKNGVSSGHIDLFYTPLDSSRFELWSSIFDFCSMSKIQLVMHSLVWKLLFVFSEIKKGARKPFNSRQLSEGSNGPFWMKVLTYSDFNLKKSHEKILITFRCI